MTNRATKIDVNKKYTIQTYSFYDAVITVYWVTPTTHHDGTEHYYKYDHHQEVIAVVPLHFSYELDWDDAQKLEQVTDTVDALKKAYEHYPDAEVGVTFTMNTSCVNHE